MKNKKKSDEPSQKQKSIDEEQFQKILELTNDLKRVQADFENYKKRSEKENGRCVEYARADVVKKMLPVLDSFEMALKSTDNHKEFVKGMELIYTQFFSSLKDQGLKYIPVDGKKFDPHIHEVMLFSKSENEDGTILEELQKGYMLKDVILRHPKVKVSKKD